MGKILFALSLLMSVSSFAFQLDCQPTQPGALAAQISGNENGILVVAGSDLSRPMVNENLPATQVTATDVQYGKWTEDDTFVSVRLPRDIVEGKASYDFSTSLNLEDITSEPTRARQLRCRVR
jgi:hypothetical protein